MIYNYLLANVNTEEEDDDTVLYAYIENKIIPIISIIHFF